MDRDEVVGLGDQPVGRPYRVDARTAETHALRAQNASLKELLQRFVASHADLPGSQGEPCRCECCQEAITLIATSPSADWLSGKAAR